MSTLAFLVTLLLTAQPTDSKLYLDDVLAAVDRHYPLILAAEAEREIARGKLQRARGSFDTELGVDVLSAPQGFYENDTYDLSVTQPLRAFGAEIGAGYRLGDGNFAEYEKDRLTNDDGEFRITAKLPLLRDRAIDSRRASLRKAEIGTDRIDATLFEQRLQIRRSASFAYWEWLAAGEKLRIAQSLTELAENRREVLGAAAEEGLIAEIILLDNERLLAERRAGEIAAERRLQRAAITLSLFLRDEAGETRTASFEELPSGFPALSEPKVVPSLDLEQAWANRPEIVQLELDVDAAMIEIARAKNSVLPSLDLGFKASQDNGAAASIPDDKAPFELEAGITFNVPIQRRRARGDLRQRENEQRRLEQRLRLAQDRVSLEVSDAHSAWYQAYRRYEQALRSVALARELEEAERFQLVEGNSDLLRLNIREQQTASAAAFVVDVMTEFFEARSDYEAAIGAEWQGPAPRP